MSNQTEEQKLPDRETEVLLRDFADEWGTLADAAEQGGSLTPRLTKDEAALLRRAADELEQEKQTAEALAAEINKLRRIKSLIQRALQVDIS